MESISLKECLEQIDESKREPKRQTIRVVSDGRDRKVYLDPGGILLTCVESVDVHIGTKSQWLVMSIPDNHFELDLRKKA